MMTAFSFYLFYTGEYGHEHVQKMFQTQAGQMPSEMLPYPVEWFGPFHFC